MKKEEDADMVMFGSSKSKRAQAAMEFLMTYGWAILVVLVVIGALAYFGVLSPATLLPEKCTFPVSVSCTDHSVSPTGITLVMQNGAGRDMIIRHVNASSDAIASGDLCSYAAPGLGFTLRNGASGTFNLPTTAGQCDFFDTGRDKNRYNINFSYSWLDSIAITHTLPGELLGRKP
ncbi:MAG: hypothetical protein HY447_05950 [Candidatus Omnitrophica bacterium]|nr:hypothetical protein [Candidatus Omnitrophota bacterium]